MNGAIVTKIDAERERERERKVTRAKEQTER